MATETLTIKTLTLQNNYIIVGGELGPKGATRIVQYFYPKVNTNFGNFQQSEEVGGKVIITNFFTLKNHMTGGSLTIPELDIPNITDGKQAFTITTFIEFCTLNTGA